MNIFINMEINSYFNGIYCSVLFSFALINIRIPHAEKT